MTTILRNTVQQAKRFYPCDACAIWINAALSQHDVSADDWLIIEGAEADKWRIMRGQDYRKVVYVEDGEIKTYRARLDMDSLCERIELFDEN